MKNIKIVIGFISLMFLGSCSGFLEVTDLNQYTSGSVFKTETDMNFALNQLYTFLPQGGCDENREWVPYFWTDDAIHRNRNSVGRMGSDYNWITAQQPGISYVLDDFYRYDRIADINFFLEAIPGAKYTSEILRKRHAAEARFIRALIYEKMVLAYGDVALITAIIDANDLPSRTPRLEVFNWVIGELNEIGDQLPVSYPSSDAGRITKGAVLAIKARAYLDAIGWNPDKLAMYKGAEDACLEIINSGVYLLESGIGGFAKLFTSAGDGSKEVVLSNIFVPDLRTQNMAFQIAQKGSWRGSAATSGNNQSNAGYTSDFIEEVQTINGLFPKNDPLYNPANPWANRDPRLAVSAVLPGDKLPAKANPLDIYVYQPHPTIAPSTDDITTPANPTGYSFKKYLDYSLNDLGMGDADYKIIRYSEVLLMYAEALAGRGANTTALTYLDMVRQRVGMPKYATIGLPTVTRGTTGNKTIDAILLERRYEFAGEGPQRWFDIWRYKLGAQVIGQVYGIPQSKTLFGDLVGPKYTPDGAAYNRHWDDKFYLLPIFQNIIDANSNIEQNPGW